MQPRVSLCLWILQNLGCLQPVFEVLFSSSLPYQPLSTLEGRSASSLGVGWVGVSAHQYTSVDVNMPGMCRSAFTVTHVVSMGMGCVVLSQYHWKVLKVQLSIRFPLTAPSWKGKGASYQHDDLEVLPPYTVSTDIMWEGGSLLPIRDEHPSSLSAFSDTTPAGLSSPVGFYCPGWICLCSVWLQ